MNEEILALVITLLIAILPNLAIKWVEKRQPEEALQKTTLEAANISVEVLQEALAVLKDQCTYYSAKLKQKRDELESCYSEIEKLKKENYLLRKLLSDKEEGEYHA